MLLQPKKRKFKKSQKGRLSTRLSDHQTQRGKRIRSFSLSYGDFGLVTLEPARFTARQLEAGRRAISRSLRRTGRLWIRAFPHQPITKKSTGTRMGKGKGAVSHWVSPIQPGQILYEITGVAKEKAFQAFLTASMKFPFQTKCLARREALKNS